jgi:rhomboid protease GluP
MIGTQGPGQPGGGTGSQQPYGSLPPRQRASAGFRPLVTYTIIGITVAFFIGQLTSELIFGRDWLLILLAKVNEFILAGHFWRLFTPALLHGSILHIGFNMYFLYVIGSWLERFYGHKRFLILYVVSAFAGNVLSFVLSPNPSLGASTAVFGLLAAQGIFFYRNRSLFHDYRTLLNNTILTLVINLALGMALPNIDIWGHIGGLLGGALLAWLGGPRYEVDSPYGSYLTRDQRTTQSTLLAGAAVLVVFSMVALTRFL